MKNIELKNRLKRSVWPGIKSRCYNKNNQEYKNYGGRGIKVCDAWLKESKPFVDWALGNGYKEGLQIDRIDNDGSYEPSNCRFVTNQENACNRRMTKTKEGYCGVYKTSGKTYGFEIQNKGKKHSKSGYKTALETAIARDRFIILNNFQNNLNFEINRELYLSQIEDIEKEFNIIKNKTKHPLYQRWLDIKDRVKSESFVNRNINICDEWRSSFDSFVSWCIDNKYKKELALVRIDFNKDYSPENCKFEDIKTTNERRNNI